MTLGRMWMGRGRVWMVVAERAKGVDCGLLADRWKVAAQGGRTEGLWLVFKELQLGWGWGRVVSWQWCSRFATESLVVVGLNLVVVVSGRFM
ncbi:hypothetical protein M0R45_015907 [Rubus argutus]|uniref:Uncharacterized protein n=1 Tax=Rubus argutus TaxID=59490 RepID=A0AAW1XS55_RUBAR